LPFGTQVRVTNKRNGRSVVVRINDRGPFLRGRVIDLTPAGARALGFSGLARVTLEPVSEVAGRNDGGTDRADRKRGTESFAKTDGRGADDITGSIRPVSPAAPESTASVAKTGHASRDAKAANANPKHTLSRLWDWMTGRECAADPRWRSGGLCVS
jgi:rare lipoprotein A